jgi:hypothetical protein
LRGNKIDFQSVFLLVKRTKCEKMATANCGFMIQKAIGIPQLAPQMLK